MNRPKKITLALLGIAASVGIASVLCLWSRIASPYQAPGQHRYIIHRSGGGSIPDHLTLPELPSVCPTPAPKKPLSPWDIRIKCKRCGEEYDRPARCTFMPSNEEIKHLHITPEQKARSRKAALKLLDEALKEK